ncbi:MAG: glutamate mutase L, partial [Candidatus Cloacimonetes bacterium]|nr:glutamate mutase L [Candidatus Cloacimonadota bacterium]
MEDVYICKSCGKVMRNAEDFSRNEFGADYCKACSDEFGYRRTFSQVIRETSSFVKEQLSVSEPEAKKIAVENISKIPLWMNRADLIRKQNHILIVDVGSTTTKGLLLKRSDENFEIAALQNSPTTVEKPDEDVKIGILSVIDKLQKNSGIKLFGERNSRDLSNLSEDVLFLCTSSAGGGLQILVIGLTLFDSASSGRRTAFGAGGVILDTLAIDDKRSSLEQMMLMRLLHPDIILMAGGVDGGAIAPLLRLGEILQIADPKPKFGDKQKIPLIFAGNKDARSFIGGLFKNRFDLYIVPNIRPSMKLENLQPAREKIHNLFMDNVMEQSPGYSALKEKVADDIIPTPLGVIRSLQIISDSLDENVISVDIGGATTDIFSNILGTYNRTVSA